MTRFCRFLLLSIILLLGSSCTGSNEVVKLDACEQATRLGMSQGCKSPNLRKNGVVINEELRVVNNDKCKAAQRAGMDQGCSGSGGTGYTSDGIVTPLSEQEKAKRRGILGAVAP